MYKHLIIGLLLLSCMVSTPTFAQKQLKLISYNIWNGYEWGKDTLRKKQQIAWIKAQQSDIMAMQELCAYTDKKLQTDSKKWGHKHSVLLKESGYSVGLTSKYPIQLVEKITTGMHHGALHCIVKEIHVFVIHLSPFKWKKRSQEIDILSPKIKKLLNANEKVIVCGDFNALSPIDADWYNNNKALLRDRISSDNKHQHVENLRNQLFSYSEVAKTLGLGLYDVCTQFVPQGISRISCPTLVFAKTKEEEQSLIERSTRIDYILTSFNLAQHCRNAFIYNTRTTANLSDHYPVGAIFEMNHTSTKQ
ncbi:hypothetical protein EMN47_03970 [Prolixibacteraceae bacterium JC049]|nr:hypothetical protein [Prolixibacteraceae bacterium JC049]